MYSANNDPFIVIYFNVCFAVLKVNIAFFSTKWGNVMFSFCTILKSHKEQILYDLAPKAILTSKVGA